MSRLRIMSVVEDTWGRSVVYGDEEIQPSTQNISQSPTLQNSLEASKTSFEEYYEYEEKGAEVQNSKDVSLTYLQSSLLATVLEDTLMEFRILLECNNELRVIKANVDMKILIANKYEISQPKIVDELDGINPQSLGCNDYKINKLDADRKDCIQLIIMLYKEMTLYKSFQCLYDKIEDYINVENYRSFLSTDEAKNKILRRELIKQLRQQRNHIKSVIYDADATIDALKTQVEDASLNAEMRSRYVDNWQRARTEQHLQTIEDKEAEPSRSIEYYKQRVDQEQRVHSEVELMTNIAINETLEKVEQWMDKYDKDMEGLDLKIQIKKNDYQNMLDKRIDLEETIERHDFMIKDWIHFKEEREKARLYHEKMTNSAIIVQAWWRGLLVRRQLGPFRVSKKKGGDKKK